MNLFILFQILIKSIELGLYKITGFLAKYIVSHYKPSMICEVCKKIQENNIVHDRLLEESNFYKRLGTSFNINSKAASYQRKQGKDVIEKNCARYHLNDVEVKSSDT